MEWVKTRRRRSQLYMLVIDIAQLVIDKNYITKALLLKIYGVRALLAHPSKCVAALECSVRKVFFRGGFRDFEKGSALCRPPWLAGAESFRFQMV